MLLVGEGKAVNMRKVLVLSLISIGLLAGCMSNYDEIQKVESITDVISSGPYEIDIRGYNTEVEELLTHYIQAKFGKDLRFTEKSRAKLTFTFVSEATGNAYAVWRDGTGLLTIKNDSGKMLWAGEYNYKGGMEMTGFSIRTDIEAAKLVIGRLYEQFKK